METQTPPVAKTSHRRVAAELHRRPRDLLDLEVCDATRMLQTLADISQLPACSRRFTPFDPWPPSPKRIWSKSRLPTKSIHRPRVKAYRSPFEPTRSPAGPARPVNPSYNINSPNCQCLNNKELDVGSQPSKTTLVRTKRAQDGQVSRRLRAPTVVCRLVEPRES